MGQGKENCKKGRRGHLAMEKDEQDENGWCPPWGAKEEKLGKASLELSLRGQEGAEHPCERQRNEPVQLPPVLVMINGNSELKKTTSFPFPNPGCFHAKCPSKVSLQTVRQ